jgi:hypothetical protein
MYIRSKRPINNRPIIYLFVSRFAPLTPKAVATTLTTPVKDRKDPPPSACAVCKARALIIRNSAENL